MTPDPYEIGFTDAMAIARYEIQMMRAQLERIDGALTADVVRSIIDDMAKTFANPIIPQSGDFS